MNLEECGDHGAPMVVALPVMIGSAVVGIVLAGLAWWAVREVRPSASAEEADSTNDVPPRAPGG